MSMLAKPQQISQIHAILAKMGRANDKEYKRDLVLQYSNGRATSTKDLFYQEANMLIDQLNIATGKDRDEIKAENMRRKIIALAHKMHWKDGSKADMQRINNWCINKGYLHKRLNDYNNAELPKLVSQFENVYKSYLKSI